MKLPGMPDASEALRLATRAVVALERIAEHLAAERQCELCSAPASRCGLH